MAKKILDLSAISCYQHLRWHSFLHMINYLRQCPGISALTAHQKWLKHAVSKFWHKHSKQVCSLLTTPMGFDKLKSVNFNESCCEVVAIWHAYLIMDTHADQSGQILWGMETWITNQAEMVQKIQAYWKGTSVMADKICDKKTLTWAIERRVQSSDNSKRYCSRPHILNKWYCEVVAIWHAHYQSRDTHAIQSGRIRHASPIRM